MWESPGWIRDPGLFQACSWLGSRLQRIPGSKDTRLPITGWSNPSRALSRPTSLASRAAFRLDVLVVVEEVGRVVLVLQGN